MSYTHHLYKNRYSKSKSADTFLLVSLLGDDVEAYRQQSKQYMGKIVLFLALTTSLIRHFPNVYKRTTFFLTNILFQQVYQIAVAASLQHFQIYTSASNGCKWSLCASVIKGFRISGETMTQRGCDHAKKMRWGNSGHEEEGGEVLGCSGWLEPAGCWILWGPKQATRKSNNAFLLLFTSSEDVILLDNQYLQPLEINPRSARGS